MRLLAPSIALLICLNCTSKPADTETKSVSAATTASVAASKKVLVFFGNSLAAGYGLETTADAFPNRIGARIDSLGLPYRIVNAGLSGETTAGGLGRVSWVLSQSGRGSAVDIFLLELGGNDGLRGIDLRSSRKNLQAIIDTVRRANPATRIVIAGMQIPPNLGRAYTQEFRAIFSELATKNNAVLIPFLLETVGGNPKLNQPDGIHPTAEGHRIVAETVWKVIGPMVSGG